MSSNTPKTILVLAANPKGTKPLRLDEEVREIDAGLQRSKHREQFVLEQKWAARPRDIQRAMLDINPSIVHFSGHGTGDEGLVFEDETGATKLVNGESLAGLFELFAERVECVVLNGCYSEVQATAIAQHVNYVIGMSKAIGDPTAIEFAVAFYDALGAGRPVEFAHKFGCAAIRLAGIPEQLTPVLKKKPSIGETVAKISSPSDQPASTKSATSIPSNAPIEVFLSYSHKDEQLHEKIEEPEEEIQEPGHILNNKPHFKKTIISIGSVSLLITGLITGSYNSMSNKSNNNSIPSDVICPNLKENQNIKLPIADFLSCGEKPLISGSILSDKQKGIEAYQKNDYVGAISLLGNARKEEPSDPETLIYLNNARIEKDKIPAYTIAVVVPINNNLYTSLQILRGVAQAQDELLSKEGYQPKIGLKVLIANDANDVNRAKEIANFLVNQPRILAVIGHYASDLTINTRDIYKNGKLVVVSPGSTSEALSLPNDNFFFRTIPSVRQSVRALAQYLGNHKYAKVVVFHNPSSAFSTSFVTELEFDFSQDNINIINDLQDRDFLLSNPFFNPSKAIKKANARGVKAFILIPDGGTTNYSIRNAFKVIEASPDDTMMVGANTLFTEETLLLGEKAVNRLVVLVPWIQTIASQSNFAKNAENLWQGKEISSWAVTAYDAAKVLIQALFINIKDNPTRVNLQATLIEPKFEAKGADENSIKFDKNGARIKQRVELAKIVKVKCSEFGYGFVPEEYQEEQIQQLESSCR